MTRREYISARQRHRVVVDMVTSNGIQSSLAKRIHNTADTTPVNGTAAHSARFSAGIQRAGSEYLAANVRAGPAHQIDLGVTGHIARDADRVFCLEQHGIVGVNQHRAKWVIAISPRAARNLDGAPEKV